MRFQSKVIIGFALLLASTHAPSAQTLDFDIVKYTLIGARDLIPDMQVSYSSLYKYGPNPNRADEQRKIALTSLRRNYLDIPLDKYDRIIQEILDTEINPDGSTQQEYDVTSFLSGEKLKTVKKTDFGPIAVFGQHRILITDGQNVSEGAFLGSDDIADDRFIWIFSDPIRKPYTHSSLRVFDSSLFPPSFFGYKPGEMLKEGCTINRLAFYDDRPEIAWLELNDTEGEIVGFFEIDTTKGLIATRGLFFTTPDTVKTYSFIQFELHDIQEVSPGFYFPQSATILHRTRNQDRSLPAGFIENPQPSDSDQYIDIALKTIEIGEQGIPDDEFIAPVKTGDQIDDYRASVIARADEGFFPHDLYFNELVMDVMKKYLETKGSVLGLSGGIAGPEYNYLELP